MSNSVELINKQILTLDRLNGHDGNPGSLLIAYQDNQHMHVPGINTADMLAAYEHMLPKEHVTLPDGTVYVPLHDSRSWDLLAQISPGSLVGLTFSDAKLDANTVTRALAYEKFAVVSEHTPFQTTAIGWHKVLTRDRKMQPWDLNVDAEVESTYNIRLNEPQKAQVGITRLLNGTGVEGSQMTGVFNIAQQMPLDPSNSISSMGCYSHNSPMNAIAHNILRQTARPMDKPIVLDRTKPMSKAYMRIGLGLDDYSLVGVGLPVPEVPQEVLTYLAFERLALDVAATNPQNSGTGTDPNHVFDITVENAPRLVEAAQNGIPIGVFQQDYRNQLTRKVYVP